MENHDETLFFFFGNTFPYNLFRLKDPESISCPICQEITFEPSLMDDGTPTGDYKRPNRKENCPHICGSLKIIRIGLADSDESLFADMYFPNLEARTFVDENMEEFKDLMIERAPDNIIRVDTSDNIYKHYMFFKSEGFGFFGDNQIDEI